MNAPDISPTTNPNSYAILGSGSVALFIVHEAKSRLGVDLTLEEAGYIVIGATTVVTFFAHLLGGKKKPSK
jgi:hypothetical protein